MPAHRAPVELLDEHVGREGGGPDQEPCADDAEAVRAREGAGRLETEADPHAQERQRQDGVVRRARDGEAEREQREDQHEQGFGGPGHLEESELAAEEEAGHADPVPPERVVDDEVEVVADEVRQHARGHLHDAAEGGAHPEHRALVVHAEVRQLRGEGRDDETEEADQPGIGGSAVPPGAGAGGRIAEGAHGASMATCGRGHHRGGGAPRRRRSARHPVNSAE